MGSQLFEACGDTVGRASALSTYTLVLAEAIAYRNACSLSTDSWGLPVLQGLIDPDIATSSPAALRAKLTSHMRLLATTSGPAGVATFAGGPGFAELTAMLPLL